MNFKNTAAKLEQFLAQEFTNKLPLLVLDNKTIIYKKYKIRQNKQGDFALLHQNNDIIDTFRLKATATIAAKYYHYDRFDLYNQIKNLDHQYYANSLDAFVFQKKLKKAKDIATKDIYLARWDLTSRRAKLYKEMISSIFKNSF